ncbi:MAG: hypothetical protein ACJAQT_004735 [Akkermansiaceae bacterium]|jgi:hypothetical protein
MEDERGHEENVAGLAFADACFLVSVARDFGGGDFTETVASGDELESSVLGRGVVEMESEGDHAFEEGEGRLDVRGLVFD